MPTATPLHFSSTPKRGTALIALLALLGALTATACAADVYRWRDENGRTHYSDHPIAGAERIAVKAAMPSASPVLVRVAKVYDGDTIVLQTGERVRLLGINTPEIGGGRKSEEAGGQDAKAWLTQKIGGRKLRLEQDATIRDKYQRLLAHVFTEDGVHINLALVEAGLATTDIYPPNLKYVDALIAAERRAELGMRGLWARPEYQPKPVESLRNQRPSGWQRLVGKPYTVAEGRSYWRLLFNDQFDVRIPKDNLALFPPLQSYLHQAVEARGWASRRGESYSILARHPSALIRR